MTAPVRVQRKRLKGWRMPPNTAYVGRPTIWGNPFGNLQVFVRTDGDPVIGADATFNVRGKSLFAADVFGLRLAGDILPASGSALKLSDRLDPARATILHRLHELRGKNLCCWCRPGRPCHADVLLELANA